MRIADGFILELEQEAATTRRLLERIPEEHFSWKPHAKSYSLGQLALHVAQIPDAVSGMASQSLTEPPHSVQGEATSREALLAAHDASIAAGKKRLNGWDDAQMMETWSMSVGDNPIMSMPRVGLVRAIMFNHLYHHRGQLQVYLRLLDHPVPSVYGPTADENPFG